MYVAIMHTEHYQWVALGRLEDSAKRAIISKWHEAGRAPTTLDELEEGYGISVYRLEPGDCVYE